VSRRRYAGAGGLRRSQRCTENLTRYLLDYSQATVVRATEAALVDPRQGWAFVKNVTGAEALSISEKNNSLPLTEAITWDTTGGASVAATGVADPSGGTDAVTLEDTSAGAYQYIYSELATGYSTSDVLWISGWVKLDATATHFPAIGLMHGTSRVSEIQIDLATGEVRQNYVGTQPNFFSAVHDGWVFFAWRYQSAWTSSPRINVYPAVGTTPFVQAAAGVGQTTVWGLRISNATTLGEDLANPTPWAGPNQARILPDDAILVEGARTNQIEESENIAAPWSVLTQSFASQDDSGYTAPDGSSNGTKFTADSAAGRFDMRNSLVVSDSLDYTWSQYLQAPETGEAPADIVLRMRNQEVAEVADTVSVPATWTRYARTQNQGTVHTTTPHVGLQEETSGVEGKTFGWWGGQVEQASYASSPIRTSGAGATRNVDVVSFADGTVLDSGKWTVGVVPEHNDSDLTVSQFAVIYSRGGGFSNALSIRDQAGTPRFFMEVNGTILTSQVVSWSAGSRLTFTVDWPAREVTIAGFDSGNGTYALGGSDDWSSAASATLYVGSTNAAGSSSFNGVIERPVAA